MGIIVDIKDGSTVFSGKWWFVIFTWFVCVQGLATIPVSAFYSPEHGKEFDKYIRFCFVKVNPLTVVS